MVLEKKIFKWPHPILHFCNYLPLEEDLALHLYKLEFPSPKDNLYQVCLILVSWFWRRFFKTFCVFLLVYYYLPLEKGYLIPLNKFESPSPKDNLCQVWLKLAQWFWRRRLLNDPTPLLHFSDYLPFEYCLALYLNKLEFPSPKNNLYQVWLILVSWFLRRFFKIFCVFLLVYYYFPLGKGYPLHLYKLESSHPRMICAKSG